MTHGLGALDKGFRGLMTHKFSNLLLALFRKLFALEWSRQHCCFQ